MTIQLRLFGELRHFRPAGSSGRTISMTLADGTTALQLILQLGIPYGGGEGQMVVAVDDVEVDHNAVLKDGDTVSLFEPLAGG